MIWCAAFDIARQAWQWHPTDEMQESADADPWHTRLLPSARKTNRIHAESEWLKTKEQREKELGEGFLRIRELVFTNLRLLNEFCPYHDRNGIAGPDLKVDVVTANGPQRIAIEIVEYHHDVGPQGSAGRRIEAFFERFRGVAYEACLWKNRDLGYFCPQIKCRHDQIPINRDIPILAREFAEFLSAKSGGIERFDRFDATQFEDFLRLARHFESILLFRRQRPVPKLEWFSGYATQIGVDSKEIYRLIVDHRKGEYALDDVEESWLVICSTRERGSGVGPAIVQRLALHNSTIDECVKNVRCRFQHVFFWDQNLSWYEELGNTQGSQRS